MADPRHENCRGYRLENGQVTGVYLDYLPQPASRYELLRVTLIPENQAGGQTVATITVLDKAGLPDESPVVLAYPWTGDAHMAHQLLPGNPARPVQHMITNGYDAAAGHRGPLAIYVCAENDLREPNSDVIGGLGLPNNRHVSFALTFRERGGTDPEPEPEPGPGNMTETNRILRAIALHIGVKLEA